MNQYKKLIPSQFRHLSLFSKQKPFLKYRSKSIEPKNNLNIFTIEKQIFQKNCFRRKSCYCLECGKISKFQYKYSNLKQQINQKLQKNNILRIQNVSKMKIVTLPKCSTFFKYKKKQIHSEQVSIQQTVSLDVSPRQYEDQKEQQKQFQEFLIQVNQHEKIKKQIKTLKNISNSQQNFINRISSSKKNIVPYFSHRRIEFTYLKPLQFKDKMSKSSNQLYHIKTLSNQF